MLTKFEVPLPAVVVRLIARKEGLKSVKAKIVALPLVVIFSIMVLPELTT